MYSKYAFVLLLITLFSTQVYSLKVFCGKTSACSLPGVGPTYSCGNGLEWSGYEAGTNEKYWGGNSYSNLQSFRTCCEEYSTKRYYCI
ncbi:MAG: hypothetical protein EXX96DRAFT_573555, partial [Benjaminiella poitrasii]